MPSRSEDELLAHGIELFNTRYFFEAHEILEDVWMKDRSPTRKFYQGLIQIAGGYHHYQNGNHRGAVELLIRGSNLLRPYGDAYLGVDLRHLLAHVAGDAEAIQRLRDGVSSEESVVLPKIRFEPAT